MDGVLTLLRRRSWARSWRRPTSRQITVDMAHGRCVASRKGCAPVVDMIGRNMKGAAAYTGLRSRIRLGLNGIRLRWPHCRAAVRLPDCMLSLAIGLVALLVALAACGTVSGTAT